MRRLAAIVSFLATLAASTAAAQTHVRVDVELVLAVDVSRSMSPRELAIQRRGYAAAIASEEVLAAIAQGFHGRAAVTYVEWAGAPSQRTVIPWTLIDGPDAANAFAAGLLAHRDEAMRRTSISGAIDFAATLFDGNGFDSARRVIDISGDGPNNQGRIVTFARDAAVAQGLTINGLPLMTREGLGAQLHLPDLDRYYYHCVIGGFGAFVIPVLDWADFPAAVRRKLVLELSGAPTPRPRARAIAAAADGYDCLIGERIWDMMFGDMP